MIIPTNQNQKALILDMDGRIDGITKELSETFELEVMFIKYKNLNILKICPDAN